MVSPKSCKFFTDQFSKSKLWFQTSTPSKLGKAECGGCQALYILYRAVWALWWIAVFIYDFIDESDRAKFWIYLTNWSYMAAGISSILQFISAIYTACNAKKLRSSEGAPFLFKINWFMYSLATTGTVVVSILYWTLIFEDGDGLGFTNIATHAVNSAYALSDLFITGVPFRLLHFWVPQLFAICYVAFSLIYWAISDSVVYDVLDYGDNLWLALAYAAGSLVAGLILHVLLFFLYWIRVLCYDCCACWECGDSDDTRNHNEFMDYNNPNYLA